LKFVPPKRPLVEDQSLEIAPDDLDVLMQEDPSMADWYSSSHSEALASSTTGILSYLGTVSAGE